MVPDGPNMVSNGPHMVPDGPHTVPDWPHMVPTRSQMALFDIRLVDNYCAIGKHSIHEH